MPTNELKNIKCKSADDAEDLYLTAAEMSQILQLRACTNYCYSINDLIIDFLLVTTEDFSKFRK